MIVRAVIPIFNRNGQPPDWAQSELAEFYRVEASLISAGMRVDTDRGMTDEGDPWFVFCQVDDDQDVIIHFARIAGTYLISASGMGGMLSGNNFRELVQRLLAQHDRVAKHSTRNDSVVLHPSAMLWVLVAMAFLQVSEARAFGSTIGQNESLPVPTPLNGRSTEVHDPVAALSSYALQPIMGAWGSSLGALATMELYPANRLYMSEVALDSLTNHIPTVGGSEAALASAADPDQHYQETAPALDAHAPSGGSSVPVIAAEALTVPVSGEHAVDKIAVSALKALPEQGAHGLLEPSFPQTDPDSAVPVPPQKEAAHVLTTVSGHNADATAAAVVPDAVAGVLDHAMHLSGDRGEAFAKAAELQDAATAATARGDATVPTSIDTEADAVRATHGATVTAETPDTAIAAEGAVVTATAAVTTAADVNNTAVPIPVAPPAPAAAAPAPTPSSADTSPHPPTASPPSPPTPNADQQKLTLVLTALHEFMVETPAAKVVSIKDDIVVYDSAAVNEHSAELNALTFDFSDGSHISLVGLATELAHVLTLH